MNKTNSAWHLPEDEPVVISFSGGRSSAYMLYHILLHYDFKLPENVKIIFCNTGKEKEETFAFIHRFAMEFKVHITWLEYEYLENPGARRWKHNLKEVSYETASRDGKPFEQLIRKKYILPRIVSRFCTKELKVMTIDRWMRWHNGIHKWWVVLGIRGDEESRLEKIVANAQVKPDKHIIGRVFPMAYADVTQDDVQAFWKKQSFDLGMPSEEGNCDYCFAKSRENLIRTIQKNNGEGLQWWIDMEDYVLNRPADRKPIEKPADAQFSKGYSYRDLVEAAKVEVVLDEDVGGGIDCFCGD